MRGLVSAVVGLAGLAGLARAQPVSLELGDDRPPTRTAAATPDSPFGRRVVEIRFRPAFLQRPGLPLQLGQVLSPESLSAALNDVAGSLTRHSERIAEASGANALIATYVDAQFELDPRSAAGVATPGTVAVTLRPLHLFLPLDDPGGRILPLPRGLSAAALRILPALLLALRPAFTSDRTLGPTVGGTWAYAAALGNESGPSARLRLRAGGMKSVDSTLYRGNAGAGIARDWTAGLLRQVLLAGDAAAAREPRGETRYDSGTWSGRGGATLAFGANTRVVADARYASVRQRLLDPATSAPWGVTHELGARVLYETIPRPALGFFRAALWQDTAFSPTGTSAQRLAGRAGYSREIPAGANQGVGLEVIAGAGQTWGNLDRARRFYAGGLQGEFLYENPHADALAEMPGGPLVRSLGHAQGRLRPSGSRATGGSRYWHVNLNVALPVPAWSRPLIPDEPTDLPGPDGSPQTLKQILRTQIDRTGPNMLQSTLQTKDGLAPDEARRQAAAVFDEIRPAARFVIDQANVFAVKPLLMFDAAGLASGPERESWLAAGFGVQVTIVTAKFETGYMRTVRGPTFGARGNLFARLGFERLF